MTTETDNTINELRAGQIAISARIDRLKDAMHARIDALNARIDRLFYAIIGGSIAVVAALLVQGFIRRLGKIQTARIQLAI